MRSTSQRLWFALADARTVVLLAVIAITITTAGWLRARQPFAIERFQLEGAHLCAAVAVVPRQSARVPVAVFIHDVGDDVISDGRLLRSIAATGAAAVSIQYNEHDHVAMREQLAALDRWIRKTTRFHPDRRAVIACGAAVPRLLRVAPTLEGFRGAFVACVGPRETASVSTELSRAASREA